MATPTKQPQFINVLAGEKHGCVLHSGWAPRCRFSLGTSSKLMTWGYLRAVLCSNMMILVVTASWNWNHHHNLTMIIIMWSMVDMKLIPWSSWSSLSWSWMIIIMIIIMIITYIISLTISMNYDFCHGVFGFCLPSWCDTKKKSPLLWGAAGFFSTPRKGWNTPTSSDCRKYVSDTAVSGAQRGCWDRVGTGGVPCCGSWKLNECGTLWETKMII